jgi:hypothetical protein
MVMSYAKMKTTIVCATADASYLDVFQITFLDVGNGTLNVETPNSDRANVTISVGEEENAPNHQESHRSRDIKHHRFLENSR